MKLPTDQTGNRTRSVVLVIADDAAAAYLSLLLGTHGAQS